VPPEKALTSVNPAFQVTDAPSGVHPVKQALEALATPPATSPTPSPGQ
jgi:hypothetical protein